jgi:hypothetical protein
VAAGVTRSAVHVAFFFLFPELFALSTFLSFLEVVFAAVSAAGPYTGFMHEPSPGVNNWTMPHALPAAVQVGGMGGGNNPSAVPARTGPGQEGWAKSEFGANSWPSFESISPQLPKDQWSMGGSAAKQRNWNVSNIISGFFGLKAAAVRKSPFALSRFSIRTIDLFPRQAQDKHTVGKS